MGPRRSPERVIAVALVGFAWLFAIVRANRSAAFDLAATLRLQAWEHPALATVMRAASWPGFPPQSRLIPPAIIAAWLAAGRRRAAAFQLAAWGGAAISTVLKAAIRRPRPLPPAVRVVVAPLGGTSFPSGHVLTYVAFYGFLGFLLAEHMRDGALRNASVASVSAVLALVGPSRIQQGHHWTTDVVASYLLGLAYLLALVELYRATMPRRWYDRLAARG
ncbi:MAG TPA: phosphatase PAP2 family protein [Candidatus Limnocylindria bacterium]|nr:phosphatase PAP2 family protein [Candidatus Limnocylindria bacterium]